MQEKVQRAMHHIQPTVSMSTRRLFLSLGILCPSCRSSGYLEHNVSSVMWTIPPWSFPMCDFLPPPSQSLLFTCHPVPLTCPHLTSFNFSPLDSLSSSSSATAICTSSNYCRLLLHTHPNKSTLCSHLTELCEYLLSSEAQCKPSVVPS